jgi:hypothetical protein
VGHGVSPAAEVSPKPSAPVEVGRGDDVDESVIGEADRVDDRGEDFDLLVVVSGETDEVTV